MSMAKNRFAILLLGLALALQGGGTSAPMPGQEGEPILLRFAGSTSMLPLVRELCAEYGAQHPLVPCDLVGVGTDSGLELLRRGRVDLAMVSRELETDEVTDVRTANRLLNFYPIAEDAVAVIVNQSNPVRELDLFNLRRLYQGRISDWGDLGANAGEILPVSREDGSATRQVFEELVMSGYSVSSGAVVMPGSQAVVDYVTQHADAVGYVSLGYVASDVAAIRLEGVEPNRASLLNGGYAIHRPLALVSLPATTAEVAAFVAFARGPRGQAISSRLYGDVPAQTQGQP